LQQGLCKAVKTAEYLVHIKDLDCEKSGMTSTSRNPSFGQQTRQTTRSMEGFQMSKFKVDSDIGNVGHSQAEPPPAPAAAVSPETVHVPQTLNGSSKDEAIATAATVGVVAVGAALIEAALIPGIIIGVAAALAPKYVPQMGSKLRPLFKTTVGGVYKLGQKTREAVAETRERMQDLVAEVAAEQTHGVTVPAAASTAATVAAPEVATALHG
jgi:hypothetical protein